MKNSRITTLSIFIGLILVIGVGVIYAGNDKGSWSEERLAPFSVAPGEKGQHEIILIHQGNRGIKGDNIDIKVSENLKSLIKVIAIKDIEDRGKDKQTEFTLEITPSSGEDIGVITGVGTLVKKNGSAVNGIPELPIEITISNIPLPPDPAEEGKQTLEGIDLDGDGLRDDVQRHIVLTYPNSAQTRAALIQISKAKLAALLNANSESKSVRHSNEFAAGAACLHAIIGDFDQSRKIRKELTAKILNTRERVLAHIRYNDQLGGHVFELLKGQSHCNF